MRALRRVEVSQRDQSPSGFQLSFLAEPDESGDFTAVASELLLPFNRVLMRIAVDGESTTLIDGYITHQQHMPTNGPADSQMIVTGEDLSVKMDMIQLSREFPSFNDAITVTEILAPYLLLGIVPEVVPTVAAIVPLDYVPQQSGTDRELIQQLAQQNGYVFHLTPTSVPFVNTAYWGPPHRDGPPAAVIDVAVGAASTGENVTAQYDALAPVTYYGLAMETYTDPYLPIPILTTGSSRMPPLAARPALTPATVLSLDVKHHLWQCDDSDPVRALLKAQAATDLSTDAVVTLSCDIEPARLGRIVNAPSVVGMRGTGASYDGLYYLKSATHTIDLLDGQQWNYKQSLVMTREGVGTTTQSLEAQ
jgi:hypothetical protein